MMIKKYRSYLSEKESEGIVKKRKNTIKVLVISFLCVILFVRCSDDKSNEILQEHENSEPLTDEKCVNFAEQLHFSFVDSNVNYINSYIDWKSIENELVAEDPLRKAIYDTLVSRYDLASDFVTMTYSKADVRFITYYQRDDHHYIIFRVFEQPQNLNVYEFELKGNSKELYIADIYDYGSASSIRSSLESEINFWSQWGKEWKGRLKMFNEVQLVFKNAMMKGDLKSAFLVTKELPEEFGELKRFRQMYGLICESSSSVELLLGYLEEELARIPLTEKGRWLPLFYLRTIEGNYGEGLIALSNLEKEVGEDVYIDFLKGNVYFEMQDYESAISYFNKALSVDAGVEIFHLGKIHSYINLSFYTEAVESLLVMDDSFDIKDLDWKSEFDLYPEFVSSLEFEEFLSRLD